MNIKQAKEQVKKTCVAYLTKDAFGEYVMPIETQRPIVLLGAPGIGKTAIMAQVAAKLGGGGASLRDIAASFNERLGEHKRQGVIIEAELASALDFMDAAWGEGNEMTVALNEMTMNKTLSAFIAKHGCDAYYNRSETLMLDARAERLTERLAQLEA